MTNQTIDVPVLIVGGGPVGLALAIDLGGAALNVSCLNKAMDLSITHD